MLAVLRQEGFDVSARQLGRLRTRNRWLLRLPSTDGLGGKSSDGNSALGASPSRSRGVKGDDTTTAELILDSLVDHGEEETAADPDEGDGDGENNVSSHDGGHGVTDLGDSNAAVAAALQTAGEAAARRGRRRQQLEAESAERWESRKRRRRTRGWAGLPADPVGCPPRFPSETTLTESKAMLCLDAETYSHVRREFQRICEAEGLLRKTAAGQAAWDEAKARLVRETPHLHSIMGDSPTGEAQDADAQDGNGCYDGAGAGGGGRKKQRGCGNRMALALDIICTDVTKRLRASEGTGPTGRRPTLAEVKNTLGVNPDQARCMRLVLNRILAEEQFTTKLEVGGERWEELKRRWQDESPELREALRVSSQKDTASDEPVDKTAEEQHRRLLRAEKLRAAEFMARDIMKRFRDDRSRRRNKDRGSVSARASTETPPLLLQQLSIDDNDEAAILEPGIVGTDMGDRLDGSSDANGYGAGLSLMVPGTPMAHLQLQQHMVQVQDQMPQQMHHGAPQHSTPVMVAPGGLSLDAHMGSSSLLLAADAQAAAFVSQQQQYMQDLQHHQAPVFGQHEQHQHQHQHHHHQAHHERQRPSLAVFLQLHPRSSIMGDFQELWVATIGGGTSSSSSSSSSQPGGSTLLEELKAGAVEKFAPGVVCVMVEGLVKDSSKVMDDVPLRINDERELAAYLQHVDTVGGAPRFNVLLQYGVG